jgi:hypothetical protein
MKLKITGEEKNFIKKIYQNSYRRKGVEVISKKQHYKETTNFHRVVGGSLI